MSVQITSGFKVNHGELLERLPEVKNKTNQYSSLHIKEGVSHLTSHDGHESISLLK
jgi:hypothetical protein